MRSRDSIHMHSLNVHGLLFIWTRTAATSSLSSEMNLGVFFFFFSFLFLSFLFFSFLFFSSFSFFLCKVEFDLDIPAEVELLGTFCLFLFVRGQKGAGRREGGGCTDRKFALFWFLSYVLLMSLFDGRASSFSNEESSPLNTDTGQLKCHDDCL